MTKKKSDDWITRFRRDSVDVWHEPPAPGPVAGDLLILDAGKRFYFLASDGNGWFQTDGWNNDPACAIISLHGGDFPEYMRWMRLVRKSA